MDAVLSAIRNGDVKSLQASLPQVTDMDAYEEVLASNLCRTLRSEAHLSRVSGTHVFSAAEATKTSLIWDFLSLHTAAYELSPAGFYLSA